MTWRFLVLIALVSAISLGCKESAKSAEDYNKQGNAKYKLGDKQGAIADFNQANIAGYNKAILINPNDADSYFRRGLAKYELGDKQGAIADFTKVVLIKPQYAAGAYYVRGFTKSELGDKQGALSDFRKALELFQQQGNTEGYNKSRDMIKELGG